MPGKMARSDPRPSVRITRSAGSGQHLASVLQEGRGNANIDTGLGFIWRISVPNDARRFMIVLNRACASADISLVRMTVSALIAVSFASCTLAADYCSNIQNLPPLVDLGPGQTYQGY